MDTLLDRFLRYVKVDTQSDETSPSFPSTKKQLDLSRMLCEECEQLGLEDVTISEYGIVMATIPGTVEGDVPAIGWVAHVDTSPEFSGTNVKPVVHENYDGSDLVLPGDSSRVLRVSEEPRLKEMVGKTVITTDGTTLLGADDKSGVAVMMSAAAHLMSDRPQVGIRPCRMRVSVETRLLTAVIPRDSEPIGIGVCLAFKGMDRLCDQRFLWFAHNFVQIDWSTDIRGPTAHDVLLDSSRYSVTETSRHC